MTNLYKELSLNPDLSASELQETLRQMLVEIRRMFSNAASEEESEHIENRMILVKEAMRVFSSDASKAAYDAELQAEQQQQHEPKPLKAKDAHMTNETIQKLLRDAVDQEDWGQVPVIASIIEERGCEDAEYYAALVRYYEDKQDNKKALSLLEEGLSRFGAADSGSLPLCALILGESCMLKENFDVRVAQRCVEIALQNRDKLNGLAEVLDVQFELAQRHYPLALQKVHQIAAAYSHDDGVKKVLSEILVEHIDRDVTSVAGGVEYFRSNDEYQLYQDLMNAAISVATDNKSQLQSKLDSWEEKKLIKGAWWGLAGYIMYSLILLLVPDGFPYFGALLAVMGIATYFMLRVPKWHANYFEATGRLQGINNVFRIINTILGKWIYLIFKFYKWVFQLFIGCI